jgi:hypothetical protein
MRITIIILLLFFVSCNQNQAKTDTQILDFGSFAIETPKRWTKVKATGVDSYVGRIAIDSSDTADFDLGWYSNMLTEDPPQIWDSSVMENIDTTIIDTAEFRKTVILVKKAILVDHDKYRKNNIKWDTIDGRTAKIVYPIKPGIGTTGVYIDSVWQSGSGVDRFNLYGENLKPDNEKALLEALRTLKFRKR